MKASSSSTRTCGNGYSVCCTGSIAEIAGEALQGPRNVLSSAHCSHLLGPCACTAGLQEGRHTWMAARYSATSMGKPAEGQDHAESWGGVPQQLKDTGDSGPCAQGSRAEQDPEQLRHQRAGQHRLPACSPGTAPSAPAMPCSVKSHTQSQPCTGGVACVLV